MAITQPMWQSLLCPHFTLVMSEPSVHPVQAVGSQAMQECNGQVVSEIAGHSPNYQLRLYQVEPLIHSIALERCKIQLINSECAMPILPFCFGLDYAIKVHDRNLTDRWDL